MRIPVLLTVLIPAFLSCSDSSGSPAAALAPRVTNHGLAALAVIGDGALRMVAASEADQGVDLDLDGDTDDLVLHVLDLADGSLTNTGLALSRRFRRGGGPPDEVPPPEFFASDEMAVFQVSEADAGRDLDGDGVPDEIATWVYLRAARVQRGLPFGHAAVALSGDVAAFLADTGAGAGTLHLFDGGDSSLVTLPLRPSALLGAGDDAIAFALSEDGVRDLNLDGDTSDSLVVHVLHVPTARVHNTMLALGHPVVRVTAGFVGFGVSESAQGQDLNADGDTDDTVFAAVEAETGLLRLPGLTLGEFADFFSPDERLFQLSVPEDGLDTNGDGDGLDRIAVSFDPETRQVFVTALATTPGTGTVRSDRWLGVAVDEAAQGDLDLDGSGSVGGPVLHAHDLQTGRTRNLFLSGTFLAATPLHLVGLTFSPTSFPDLEVFAWDRRTTALRATGPGFRAVLGTAGETALFVAHERGIDRNDDGDAQDLVLAGYDLRADVVVHLGLATRGDAGVGPDGSGTALVPEADQGRDLNGDGDLLDSVLFSLRLF